MTATDERNRTVGAEIVASLGNLKICGMGIGGNNSVTAKIHSLLVSEGGVLLSTHNSLARLGNVAKATDTNEGIDLGQLIHYLLTVSLNKTAGGDNMTTLAPFF